MKTFIIFICLLTNVNFVYSQKSAIDKVSIQIDSILQKIDKEQNKEKRFQLVISLYGTSVEGFPSIMFKIYQRLLIMGRGKNDVVLQCNAWSFAGQGYRLTGDYIKALECHHKAIALAESSGNLMVLGYAQNQMAHIYKDRGEYDKAINLYKSAAINIGKGNNEYLKMWPKMNLGYVFMRTNQLDSSLFYSQQALEIVRKFKIEGLTAYILGNIGTVYSKKNNIPEANYFLHQAIAAAKKNQSARFISGVYQSLAEHFFRHNETDSCIYYAKKAIDIVKNTNISNLSLNPAKMLTDIYEKSNADSTLKYLKIYRAANDSLYSARANQQLQMMTFEEDQRQRDIVAQKISYQNKIKTNMLLSGFGVLLLIGLILYRNNRQTKKSNKVLENTLSNLKSTQSQLIQSEKMASLGELTAGIAHEIQNPLNFVNNFSEVNKELAEELEQEIDKGNYTDAKALAKDIKDNEEKIIHHGKRADAIVKGMLQHSRSSTSVKELTDINALADEYLRLSYHGLRAKDKSFNAIMITEFDESIGKIDIIPQDIGRVILNLINNAFYAVDKKAKSINKDYKPLVELITSKLVSHIEITVKDNGEGIPENIKEKIFQPFFTTKPTGQGTGLGLSLSYDIIKAHGGEIKVESKEGKGSSFIIKLPV